MNLALLNPKLWFEIAIAAIVIGAVWYGYNYVYDRGASSVQVQWDKEKLKQAEQSAKVSADALATTKVLAATIDQQRTQANEQIIALNSSLSNAITGLRNRPSRTDSGSVPINPATGAAIGATGADLLRQDAEFLVRESSRADKLRLQLAQCQAAYNAVRDKIN
jgi:hypothetical protein